MPLDLQEGRFQNVPVGSTATVTVTTNFNATGRIDDPSGANQNLTHASIVNKTRKFPLNQRGRWQVRVSVVATGSTVQKGTVDITVENPPGTQIRSFTASFSGQMNGQDPFIGRAKVSISVV